MLWWRQKNEWLVGTSNNYFFDLHVVPRCSCTHAETMAHHVRATKKTGHSFQEGEREAPPSRSAAPQSETESWRGVWSVKFSSRSKTSMQDPFRGQARRREEWISIRVVSGNGKLDSNIAFADRRTQWNFDMHLGMIITGCDSRCALVETKFPTTVRNLRAITPLTIYSVGRRGRGNVLLWYLLSSRAVRVVGGWIPERG